MFSESFAKATFGFSNVLFFTFFTFNHISKIVWFASDVLFDLTCLTRGAERVGGSTVIDVRASETAVSRIAKESTRRMAEFITFGTFKLGAYSFVPYIFFSFCTIYIILPTS